MKRAALVAGVSIAALICAGPMTATATPGAADRFWNGGDEIVKEEPAIKPAPRKAKPRPARQDDDRKSERNNRKSPARAEREADKTPPIPPGPLHVIVSIGAQRATLFANGKEVAETKISSGTPSHPTPMGVFTVIQKSRHHVSNLYDAPMPYMQRITWSGSALHEGPLPGRPASHGCVRLTVDFAKLLWKATKIGARVIITRDEVAPVAIESDKLFAPPPKMAQAPRPVPPPAPIKTADAGNVVPVTMLPDTARPIVMKRLVTDSIDTKPLVTTPAANAFAAEQPTKLSIERDGGVAEIAQPPAAPTEQPKTAQPQPAEAPISIIADEKPAVPAPAAIPVRRTGPVSVFVSLKERRLYVRQNWEPLFDVPVTFAHPEQPVGTHVYTAMGPKPDGTGLRWTVVSIPSHYKQVADEPKAENGKKPRHDKPIKAVEPVPAPVPSATAALDRLTMPPDAVERIAALITPGSSLIVSDNKLSGETGVTTDFIVLTR